MPGEDRGGDFVVVAEPVVESDRHGPPRQRFPPGEEKPDRIEAEGLGEKSRQWAAQALREATLRRLDFLKALNLELDTSFSVAGRLEQQSAAVDPQKAALWAMELRPELQAETFRAQMDALAVNLAISTGRIDSTLPFIKRQAVRALTAPYASTAEQFGGISGILTAFYDSAYPGLRTTGAARIRQAVAAVQTIATHSFFPGMKVDWRVYPDNIGHKNSLGCFRCHDGYHATADGRTIIHDCTACHAIIAQGPGQAAATVTATGLEFKHPVDIGAAWRTMRCSDCHHGTTVG